MGFASRLTLSVYVLIPSLTFALINVSGNSSLLQGTANGVFGSLNNPILAVYLFEALVVVAFLITGEIAILAIRRSGRIDSEEEEG